MKRSLSIIMILMMVFAMVIPAYADQVWGDAVEVTGSNHDQVIELTVNEGDSWSTPINVYVVQSGKSVAFPVSGNISFNPSTTVSKTNWTVNDYSSPDIVIVSKTEPTSGSYSYDVVFTATTDLDALSKSFDKVSIHVTVNKVDVKELDVTAPIVIAPQDMVVEALDIFTPVDIGNATSDDPEAVISNDSPLAFPLGETIVTWSAVDPSGNIGTAVQKITVVDTTPPVFTQSPVNKSVILSGPLTSIDLGSVIATDIFPVTLTNNAPAAGFPVGQTVVTWTAIDANGNTSTSSQLVKVEYRFDGFFQPINMDGSSIFKLGSTVPIKFSLYDSNGGYVSTAVASLKVAKVTDSIVGSQLEAISTSNATTGNLFRYDSTNNQYIFNLSTKSLSKGTYLLSAYLDDGSVRTVQISLR